MVLRNLMVLASTLLFFTACPDRPSTEQAAQACENLITIAHRQKAVSEAAESATTEADRAAVEKNAQALAVQKTNDPEYRETLETCIKGLTQLGTIRQSECIVKARTQKEAEACRNER